MSLLNRNLEVDGYLSKGNLLGQFALSMNATHIVFPLVIYNLMKQSLNLELTVSFHYIIT